MSDAHSAGETHLPGSEGDKRRPSCLSDLDVLGLPDEVLLWHCQRLCVCACSRRGGCCRPWPKKPGTCRHSAMLPQAAPHSPSPSLCLAKVSVSANTSSPTSNCTAQKWGFKKGTQAKTTCC